MYLFGPVPSRRYGRSLGIDLVPMKTCCYDCVFCQLGPTPHTTLERKDYAPLPDVFRELDAWLAKGEPVDVLTLCGSGEPTLHAHFGEMLRHIRALGHASLLMSNGALLFDPAVRADAGEADFNGHGYPLSDETCAFSEKRYFAEQPRGFEGRILSNSARKIQ